MSLARKLPPSEEPLTLTQLRNHVRVDGSIFDEDLSSLLKAAVSECENQTGLALMPQTWVWKLDEWPFINKIILFDRNPVLEINSIKYFDSDNTEQTLDETYYEVDLDSQPAKLSFIKSLPNLSSTKLDKVIIEFIAGFGIDDTSAINQVPDGLKHALKIHVGGNFEYRSDRQVKNKAVMYSENLFEKYKVRFHL